MCRVISSVSAISFCSLGESAVVSPKNFSRIWSRAIFSMLSWRYWSSSPMMVSTSAWGRFQFSVEKA